MCIYYLEARFSFGFPLYMNEILLRDHFLSPRACRSVRGMRNSWNDPICIPLSQANTNLIKKKQIQCHENPNEKGRAKKFQKV